MTTMDYLETPSVILAFALGALTLILFSFSSSLIQKANLSDAKAVENAEVGPTKMKDLVAKEAEAEEKTKETKEEIKEVKEEVEVKEEEPAAKAAALSSPATLVPLLSDSDKEVEQSPATSITATNLSDEAVIAALSIEERSDFAAFNIKFARTQINLLLQIVALVAFASASDDDVEEDEGLPAADQLLPYLVLVIASCVFTLATEYANRGVDRAASKTETIEPQARPAHQTLLFISLFAFFITSMNLMDMGSDGSSALVLSLVLSLCGSGFEFVAFVGEALYRYIKSSSSQYSATSTVDTPVETPQVATEAPSLQKKGAAAAGGLSIFTLVRLLRPYFWPSATSSNNAMSNRFRSIMTWVFVILSKTTSIMAPLYIGAASTALSTGNYDSAIRNSFLYVLLIVLTKIFKECQALVYLKVAQVAYVQLSTETFVHLHTLSLDWHLNKKLGDVLRSMDRGIAACDTLMSFLFLWLVPAVGECLVVCFVFFFRFEYFPLAFVVFYFIFIYCK
jgi:hypothetical protein